MNKQQIVDELSENVSAPKRVVEEWVGKALEYLMEEVNSVIPIYHVAPEGVRIANAYLVTENYIAEVRFSASPSFDVIRGGKNMRFQVQAIDIELPDPHGVGRKLNGLRVDITHDINIRSELIYIGDNQAEWLEKVVAAFGVKTLY